MDIQVLYFVGCPNHAPTVALVKQVMATLGMDATVEEVEVTSPEEAVSKRFFGSPTVLVNGVDIDPRVYDRTDYGLSCRVYHGMDGVPSASLLQAAVTAAQQSQAPRKLPGCAEE